MRKILRISVILAIAAVSCKTGTKSPGEAQTGGRVPVTVTHISIDTLRETITLNAVSEYLLKTFIKSYVNGYLQEVNVNLGDKVSKGQKMFVIRTKEAEYLGNTVNKLDSTFRFSGLVTIYSSGKGFVTQMNFRTGNYVQDGETLASISDETSLVFMLELPYELRPYLPLNKTVKLALPDGRDISGTITQPMPSVDPVSQTQRFVIRIDPGLSIPENLVARVAYVKQVKNGAVTLPKAAVLTDEQQDEFWIMKMIDSTTAVKVPVQKGMEIDDKIEILSPRLDPADLILLTGNYGLTDSAGVIIENSQK
jgi:multidrug efflux pump subunit AcrA (membrane-fusion protein)